MLKWQIFAPLQCPKLISRKIWVIEKSLNFYTVYLKAITQILLQINFWQFQILENCNFDSFRGSEFCFTQISALKILFSENATFCLMRAQCENLMIFLSLRFYVKSNLENVEFPPSLLNRCEWCQNRLQATVWKFFDFSIT